MPTCRPRRIILGSMLPGYRSAALSLVALLPVLASGSSEAQAGGQISGHVYRSDGGQAVPGAVVTLIPVADHGKALTARAAQDGSYSFQAPDLQGQYFVTAWFRGFNLAFYRVAEPGPPRTFGRVINLKSGTRFDNTGYGRASWVSKCFRKLTGSRTMG